jgi:arsenite-transporting ATPase
MATQYLFFSGKGGVGKTTMACATAVAEADKGRKTLIVTTDPASNLADVFEQAIGHQVTPIAGVSNLWAMEIDPDKATEEYRDRMLGPFREVMPEDVLSVLEEQFRSPCTTEIASFDRFVDFMDEEQFDLVIFDTAPTGHTIRLLELPVDWSAYIEESAKGAGQTCMGPVQAIQASKAKYDRAIALLGDPGRTRFVFVLQPEQTAIFETERSVSELERLGVRSHELIVNRMLPAEVCDQPFFRKRYEMQQRHLDEIRRLFPGPTRYMLLRDHEVKGVARLREVAAGLAGHPAVVSPDVPVADLMATGLHRAADVSQVEKLLTPRDGRGKAIFFAGKGGVGKTSVSCAAAVHVARLGFRTLLLTTDPAAHIGQVLEQAVTDRPAPVDGVPHLWMARIDAKRATEEYKARILEEAKRRYSDDMLAAMREELESPCTEEMAAFDKFTEYADGATYDVIVFDTAPTGHTLRLLTLPFDYSQQVELMVTTTQEGNALRNETRARFDRMIARLRDPERTVFAFVLYPEFTPMVEAHRAMLDLKAAGIPTQLVVVNHVIPAAQATNPFFARRRSMQMGYLGEIESRFAAPVLTLPLLDREIQGLSTVGEVATLLFGNGRTDEELRSAREVAGA